MTWYTFRNPSKALCRATLLKTIASILSYLVSSHSWWRRGLKRDLNSHLWAPQESCCVKVGKSVSFAFVFHESSEGGTVKASWARWSRAESQAQKPQATLGFGVQKSWTRQENTNEQLSEVSLLLGIFQVSLSASPLWKPLLCSVTHEDLFTVIFFLLLYLFTTQRDWGKERRPPFYRRLKELEDDPSSKNQMSSAFTQSSLGQPFSYRTTDRCA